MRLILSGTAINDNDYSRAVLFLESIGNSPEAQAMWRNLSLIALQQHDLTLAERCNAALGNVSTSHFLHETSLIGQKYADKYNDSSTNCPEVWAKLSILSGDLSTAENIYLEQGDIDNALDMYKKLHKWDDALRLAEQRGYEKLNDLKEEYMALLLQTAQYEKVGQVLENEGKYEQALNMYLKSNKLLRVPNLLVQHPELMENHGIVTSVLKSLVKQELFEAAAEIYEKLDKSDLAMECYRKGSFIMILFVKNYVSHFIGKAWNKAVDLARTVNPEQVIHLEEEWGDSLVESKQLDAAISHYIEAGCTLKALDTAVLAKQWKKAVHIIKVVDDVDLVRDYYKLIGNYFASIKVSLSIVLFFNIQLRTKNWHQISTVA